MLRAVADLPDVLLLESTLTRDRLGRYSFLTGDPFEFFELPSVEYGEDPFINVRQIWERCRSKAAPDLPPFQGGVAGLLSYELGTAWERLPRAAYDEFRLPAMAVGLYDWVLAWDHHENRAWVVSQGLPETDASRRRNRADRRMREILARVERAALDASGNLNPAPTPTADGVALPIDDLAPQFPVAENAGWTSDFSRDAYLASVGRIVEYIRAGDVFQVNLSQRLLHRLEEAPLDVYLRLRRTNPAPMAAWFSHADWSIASASPERFLCISDGDVEARPIKGTRRRRFAPEADLFTRDELRQSAKDQAENVMIVDLLRNDLSRICTPGTIRVPRLCGVETYETVQHLVSEIRGRLSPECSPWDVWPAVFPGGSITGAPKVRAMEIIAELEPTARGAYCGSLFYAGFDGSMDSNILIRTFVLKDGWIQCPVGGGVVFQSDPAAEYEETRDKAAGMLRAL